MDSVTLALAYYRNPLAYQERWSLAVPLPEDMGRLLALANGVPNVLEPAIRQSRAKADELLEAAQFCIQQWCLASGADAYRVLGVEPGASLEKIKEHHRQLVRLFHPDRAAGRETWTENYASRINAAYTQLSRRGEDEGQPDSPWPRHLAVEGSGGPRETLGLEQRTEQSTRGSSGRRSGASAFRPQRRFSGWKILGGSLLALLLGWSGLYLDQWFNKQHEFKPSLALTVGQIPPHDQTMAMLEPGPGVQQNTFDILRAAPDWEVLDRRENQARQRVAQAQQAREQWEEERRQQIAAEEALLEKTRAERAQLEVQLKNEQSQMEQVQAARLAAEQQSLAVLRAEQARLEQLKNEREENERQRLAAFQAEQLKAEQIVKTLWLERQRLEQWWTERRRAEQRQAEDARKRKMQKEIARAEREKREKAQPPVPTKQFQAEQAALRQTQADRQRLKEQLQVEQVRAEQAQAERAKLEQARNERAKAEQAALRQAQADRQRLKEQLQVEQARTEQAQAERAKLEQAGNKLAQAEQAQKVQASIKTAMDHSAMASTTMATTADQDSGPTAAEVNSLMRRYSTGYQRGDLRGILALFTASARSRIQEDYTLLFSTHQVLGLRLQGMEWVYRGTSADGSGRYVLRVRERETGKQRLVQGQIYFTVQKRGDRVLISAIEFEWPRS